MTVFKGQTEHRFLQNLSNYDILPYISEISVTDLALAAAILTKVILYSETCLERPL